MMPVYSISPDTLSENSNYTNFICCICLNICYEPVILKCCEKLLCINCLENMIHNEKNFPKCPYCNNKILSFSLPQKLITRVFEDFVFKCPNCEEKIKYLYYHEHIYNTCKKKKNDKLFCKNCRVIYHNEGQKEHDCKRYIEDLKNFTNKSEIEKKIAKLKLKMLKIDLEEENEDNENSEENEDGVYYNKEVHVHKLYLTNKRLNPGYEPGWVCELCSDIIRNPNQKSYHCEKCVFDICEKCILYINTRTPNKLCHNHELNLEMRDCGWECSICGNEYWKRQSWYCDLCDFDACVFCYWK